MQSKHLLLAIAFILFLSCTKEPAPDNNGGTSSYNEQHWNWDDNTITPIPPIRPIRPTPPNSLTFNL